MLIDGLKQFLTHLYDKENATKSPIKKLEETFFRSIIHLPELLIVLEYDGNVYQMELVNNSANVWKVLEDYTFENSQDLFDEVAAVVRANEFERLPAHKKVALNHDKVYNYLVQNEYRIVSYNEIGKALKLTSQEVGRSILVLRKCNRIEQIKGTDQTNCYKITGVL